MREPFKVGFAPRPPWKDILPQCQWLRGCLPLILCACIGTFGLSEAVDRSRSVRVAGRVQLLGKDILIGQRLTKAKRASHLPPINGCWSSEDPRRDRQGADGERSA